MLGAVTIVLRVRCQCATYTPLFRSLLTLTHRQATVIFLQCRRRVLSYKIFLILECLTLQCTCTCYHTSENATGNNQSFATKNNIGGAITAALDTLLPLKGFIMVTKCERY